MQLPVEDGSSRLMTLLLVIGLSLLSGIARFIASVDSWTLIGFFRGLCAAVFVGFNAHQLAEYYDLNGSLHITIVSVSAFIADYILVVLLKLSDEISQKPLKLLMEFLRRK